MTPIDPLDPPLCHLCGGATEILSSHGVAETCPRCGGTGEEPPTPAAVLEEQGQGTLFTLSPLFLVLVWLIVGIGLLDSAFFLAILVSELIDRRRQRRQREKERAELAARRELAIRGYYRVQVESPRGRERALWR
ncbi:MAG TPA: hypothetical protein VFI96_09365 [Longimicrobiaceae bacterium]|nr:hypothetical protein [Longimicrobiaceae bacterium]